MFLVVCTSNTSVVVDLCLYVLTTHIPKLHTSKRRPVAWLQCRATRKRRVGKDVDGKRDGQHSAAGCPRGPCDPVPGVLQHHDQDGGRGRYGGRVRRGLWGDLVRLVRARARGRGERVRGREVPR